MMTKLEIKINIYAYLEPKQYLTKDEKNSYIRGYLNALYDTNEIDSDKRFELLEELRYD